ncbi:MAG: hypothetical protein IPK19_17640 [Chloroflexi bacterium]|nr:hypothetical protein [Chloroflexota bacterium]
MARQNSVPRVTNQHEKLSFSTTKRRIREHWLRNILLITVLLTAGWIVSRWLGRWINSAGLPDFAAVIPTLLWTLCVLPVFASIINIRRWDMTHRPITDRVKIVERGSYVSLLALSLTDPDVPTLASVPVNSLLFLTLTIIWGTLVTRDTHKHLTRVAYLSFAYIAFIWLIGVFVISDTQPDATITLSIQEVLTRVLHLTTQGRDLLHGILLILAALLLVMTAQNADMQDTVYRLRAYWRHFTRPVRHERDRSRHFPASAEENVLNRLREFARRLRSLETFTIYLSIVLISTAVLFGIEWVRITNLDSQDTIPAVPSTYTPLIGALVLAASFLLVMVSGGALVNVIRRQRYLILPLRPSDEKDTSLASLADSATQSLVEQLQRIGTLLKLRQVENVSAGTNEVMSLFITSGQEQQFVTELQNLLSLDYVAATSTGTSLWSAASRFLFTLTRYFAEITVSGTVERDMNGEIEIVVELARRNRIILVTRKALPRSASDTYDETQLTPVTYQLAAEIVLKLGQGSQIASRVESLECFLDGLLASSNRNWWRAIESYQKASAIEEAERGSYGIGYYHIGSALVLQGEIEQGKRYLEMAEAQGLALAELPYMLALVDLSIYWNKLNEDDELKRFEQIIRRCRIAQQLRPRFAEAAHLMGAAYYQRGKLRTRERTKIYGSESSQAPKDGDIRDEDRSYRMAIQYLRQSLAQFDRAYHSLQSLQQTSSDEVRTEVLRLLRERVTAKHRLADALRASERYPEAETYYDDVLNVVPANISTLIDLSKTYCLSGSWQRADEFIQQQVITLPEGEWDPHVNLHAGWALAGGVLDEIRILLNAADTDRTGLFVGPLQRVMMHLDFALYLRPQYMTSWEQTDWVKCYAGAMDEFPPRDASAPDPLTADYHQPILPGSVELLHLQKLWLAWRQDGRDYCDEERISSP